MTFLITSGSTSHAATLAVIIVLFSASQPAFAGAHDQGSQSKTAAEMRAPYEPFVHRTNIVVADIDRALALYRDILDFDVVFVVPVKGVGILHETFGLPDDTRSRIAMLASGSANTDSSRRWRIGMSEVPGYRPPSEGIYNHAFIIEVDRDMEQLYAEVQSAGLQVGKLMELSSPTRTEFPFTDFDGHRIIIMYLHD